MVEKKIGSLNEVPSSWLRLFLVEYSRKLEVREGLTDSERLLRTRIQKINDELASRQSR